MVQLACLLLLLLHNEIKDNCGLCVFAFAALSTLMMVLLLLLLMPPSTESLDCCYLAEKN